VTELALALLPDAPPGVQWTTRGLIVTDPSLPFETVEALFRAAGEIKTAMSFIIGDLLNFAEARYSDRYVQAAEATGLSYSTLTNYASVMRKVAPSRRRESLRFSHHAEVASLEPEEQERWLAQAEERGWTTGELREALADGRAVARAVKQPAARQEVLDAVGTVDAARNLDAVRETLTRVGGGLEAETAEAIGIPRAIRALDEAGETVRRAAATLDRPILVDAARRVVANATVSGGFYMVELAVFVEFAALVATADA